MKKILKEIINKLAEERYVFSNEQDFQFTLSQKLIDMDDVTDVFLEAVSLTKDFSRIKEDIKNGEKLPKGIREYTDIIVVYKNEYYAIELKYKTPGRVCCYEKTKNGRIITMVQAAYDINAYEFIKDISRLEKINNRFFASNIKNIKKGYAIILTNEKNYRKNDFSKSSIWKKYSICEKKTLEGKLGREGDDKKYSKYKPIELEGKYELEWENYQLPEGIAKEWSDKGNNPGFSYLLVEITPKSNCAKRKN